MDAPRRAFTLLELLVVTAITAVLAALIFPAVSSVREKAAAADSTTRIRQLASLTFLYAQDNNMRFPPAINGSVYWSNPVAAYLRNAHFGVGGNSVFYDPITGNNAIADAAVRQAGLASPFSCPGVVRAYNNLPLISSTFAISAYPYVSSWGGWDNWSNQPSMLTASKPSSTVLFTQGHVSNFGSWYAAEGVVREMDFDQTAEVFKSGMPVCWLDGHVSFEKKSNMFSTEHRPGGTADYWRLVK